MSINLSSEDLKKEQERQRKRGGLIFKTLRRGVVTIRGHQDPNIKANFRYEIGDVNVRSVVNYFKGDVDCIIDCLYDEINIFYENGSEPIQTLPLWMVQEIESQIIHKFDRFNIELRFMVQSNMLTGKSGKRNLINEDIDKDLKKEYERQRKKGKLIFNTLKKGKVDVQSYNIETENFDLNLSFHYEIYDAHVKPVVDRTNGDVDCIITCFYDDVDIFNEDGSEITEQLSYLLVRAIETQIEKKFDKFNIELQFMKQLDGNGKDSVVME
jgi:hypothetical protein